MLIENHGKHDFSINYIVVMHMKLFSQNWKIHLYLIHTLQNHEIKEHIQYSGPFKLEDKTKFKFSF